MISAEVTLLNFSLNAKNTYRYRIKNQEDWQNNSVGKLSFSGLPYGKHTLEIKAFNSSQQEATNDLKIEVHVLKPFYLQSWFAILFLSITSFGGWFLVKKRKQKLKSKLTLEVAKNESEKIGKEIKCIDPKLLRPKNKNSIKKDELILQEDLDWFQQVEVIAKREIKTQNYSVDDLAQELFISRRQLYRKIKKMTGLTPKKYLKSIRLKKAKSVLETGEILTLTEVCYAVGFENTTHFANLFEAEFGERPHEYLKKSAGV